MTSSGNALRNRLSFILLGKGGKEGEAPSIDAMLEYMDGHLKKLRVRRMFGDLSL